MNEKNKTTSGDLKDSLCTARWGYPLVDFSKGEVRTCCRTSGERVTKEQIDKLGTDIFLNTDYQKERRKEMLEGVRHEACNTCWVMEDAGIHSARFPNTSIPRPWAKAIDRSSDFNELTANTELKNYTTGEKITPAQVTSESSILRSEHPYMLEINLSNACDLKCTYCSPYFSSKWEKDMELWSVGAGFTNFKEEDAAHIKNDIRKEVDDRFMDLFWEWFNGKPITTLGRVGIIGGEPLINTKLPEFLNKLIESYKNLPLEQRPSSGYIDSNGQYRLDHKPLVWFVTNLNTPKRIMDKFINVYLPQLCEYFHVEVHASLESIGKRIEYTRDGLSWELYKENAERLCALKIENFHFGFQIALNSLSMSTLTEFLKYAKHLHDKFERPIILKHNMVTFPEFHHPAILPVEFADYLEDALVFLESVKDKMRHVDDAWGTWPAYYEYIKTIHESLKNEMGKKQHWECGSLDNVKIRFFTFFNEIDKRSGSNFLEVFPEYSHFYNDCKKQYFRNKMSNT